MIFCLIDSSNPKVKEFIKNYYIKEGLTVKVIDLKNKLNNLINEFFKMDFNNLILEKILKTEEKEIQNIQRKIFNKEKFIEIFKNGLSLLKPTIITELLIDEIESSKEEIKIIDNISPFEAKYLKRYFGEDFIIIKFDNEFNKSINSDYEIQNYTEEVKIFAELNKILNKPKLLVNKEQIKKLSNLKNFIPLKKEEIKEIKQKERIINNIKKLDFDNLLNKFIEDNKLNNKEKIEWLEYIIYKFINCKKEGLSYKSTVINCFGLEEKDLGLLTYIYVFKLNKAIEIFNNNNELTETPEINIEEYNNKWNKLNTEEKLSLFVSILNEYLNTNNFKEELLPKYINTLKTIFNGI